jgi:hypothetical protein
VHGSSSCNRECGPRLSAQFALCRGPLIDAFLLLLERDSYSMRGMCKTCFDADNKVEISGIRELATLVGGGDHLRIPNEGNVYWPEELEREFREGPADNCLCPVDLGWTLLRAGFEVWLDEFGEVTFRRQPSPATYPKGQ